MSTARDDDPDLNPGEYGFSDPAPAKREAPPTKHDRYATSEPEGEEEPKPRKRKRRDGDPRDEPEEPRPKKRRRDLAYDDPPAPHPQDLDPLTRPRPRGSTAARPAGVSRSVFSPRAAGSHAGPKPVPVVPSWSQAGPKLVGSWSEAGPKPVPRRSPAGPQPVPSRSQV
ncbi:MAG: hypothetical protein ABGY75_10780, partial [Gemmataceae bacterium]